jgi:SAM-dependent methyltransferase
VSYDSTALQWAMLQKSKQHLTYDYLEKPAMYRQLENLQKNEIKIFSKILCLGCGTGEECQYIMENYNPEYILGVDNSKGLIDFAKENSEKSEIEFRVLDLKDLEDLAVEFRGSFDLVYSSLALHYVEDWEKMLTSIHKLLALKGNLVFSTHHPLKWGGQTTKSKTEKSFLTGYKKEIENGRTVKTEIYGDYLGERMVQDKLLGAIEIEYFHQPISSIFRKLIASGFIVNDIDEPKPILESKGLKEKDFFSIYSRIPLFIIMSCSPKI